MTTPLGRQPADDAGLLGDIARGEPGAFEQFVGLYETRVARLAQRLSGWSNDVDDIVQDVFVTVLEKSKNFRGEASVWTWLTKITLNRCRSHHRREVMRSRISWLVPTSARRAPAADHQLMLDEVAQKVRTAIAALSPRDREIVILFYLEDRSA